MNSFNLKKEKILKNKGALAGLIVILISLLLILLAPLLTSYEPHEIVSSPKIPPFFLGGNATHLLGTDDLGRDLLSRLLYGGRISLLVGLLVVTISMVFGILLGLLSGFYSGWVDKVIMRVMDILMSLPSILLAIVVVAILGPGLSNAIIAVSLVALPPFVRLVRAQVMAEKEKDYISAARSLGAGPMRLMFLQILPNCFAPIIVQASLGFSDGILNTASLGFLGLGAQAPLPEWGTMLADARAYIESDPWLVTMPGLCIFILVLSFNLLGDGLRDILDPKIR
jgi:ABC-type dipeptide/oligopeptide/nickel transport system permease subunit